MKGFVHEGLEPLLSLNLMFESGLLVEFTATADTGFTGTLTLPPTAIRDLGVLSEGSTLAVLADGSVIECEVYRGGVIWHDNPIEIDIDETDAPPLLGMELMQGSRLRMDIIPNGEFELLPLDVIPE